MVRPVKRIKFSYPRSDLRNPDSMVANLKGDYIVWWYNCVRHNPRAKTMPLVDVLFKKLVDDIPCSISVARVPLSNLPHYRIGTIWREGRCISDIELTQEDFSVDFSAGRWTITSRDELHEENLEDLFSDDDYPLKYRRDKSRLLKFTDSKNRTLLVPCIDFFVRGYVRNMDVCRAISTLQFSDILSCFYESRDRDAYRWVVRPSHKARDYDNLFLAHLLYDDYTEGCVRRISSQFQSTKPGDIVLPEVEPWFVGPGELRCRGKWINQGKTFLCLDLCGSNRPEGQDIEWIRDAYDSTGGQEGKGRTVMPVSLRTAEAEEFFSEESLAEPDGHTDITIVKTPPFASLGVLTRKVTKTRQVIKADKGRLGPKPPSSDSHSSGTGRGSGKNIGKSEHVADIPADVQIQSHGFLNDIWNTFASIRLGNPDRVTELSWYTPPSFGSSTPPRVILFNADGVPYDRYDILKWISLSEESSKRRGMLVIRIVVDNQVYLCFEIQRAEPDENTPHPQGFSGVLMRCDITDPIELEEFVKKVCTYTRTAVGRFVHIRGIFPKATKIFHHRRYQEELPHRRRLINAFKVLKVILN
ncbi:hypothetical protein L6227_25185 [Pseudomonas syringae pv. syringae]|uniref:hypothetical protein n=1 Tax=Pseudomonas syringae TaxID=317 RepID=UPI001F10C429|nr:hypothetical protein [Pseudomonas syringae]MCH5552545.1 hypothetical protein [Pseudomonas syringae pv. syringae]